MGEQWLGGKGLHCSVPTIKSSKFSREGRKREYKRRRKERDRNKERKLSSTDCAKLISE